MGVTYTMTCPQCNADLPDSTAFCPRCGSSIRPATFSYLPAGAPPWPTAVPRMPLYRAGSSAETTQEDANLSAAKIAPKPRRSVSSILLIIAILILVPVIGAGITLGTLWANGQFSASPTRASVQVPLPTPQATTANSSPTATSNQLPTPTSFQTTKSSAVGIAMKYPGNWTVDAPQTSTTSTIIGFHPQQSIGIFFTIERFSSATSAKFGSANDVNQGNLTAFASDQNFHNFQTLAPVSPQRTIGGVQWDEQDASFANSSGIVFHITSIAIQHNKVYYDILFSAPDVNYGEAMQKYFQPMLSSFQFQS